MPNHDPRLVRLDKLVSHYDLGRYTSSEVVGWCLAVADDAIAENVLHVLPPAIFAALKQQVCESPVTEEEWARTKLVSFGVVGGDLETDVTPAAMLARYRTAVEAFRRAFDRGTFI